MRTDLNVPRVRTHFSDRAFSAVGPHCWNRLPPAVQLTISVDSFKSKLKAYLLAEAYPTCLLFVRHPSNSMAALQRLTNGCNYYY